MIKEKRNILGIFDSGVGGFSVLQQIRKETDADIIYFGDCARAPYGGRGEEEIISFIKEILLDLKLQGVTHFVSACNSMSVVTTEKLLEEVGIGKSGYIDMVDAVREVSFGNGTHVLVVGTQATIRSCVYQNLLRQQNATIDIFVPGTLAGEIESGDEEAIRKSVQEVISYAVTNSVTHILYACTHYPLVDSFFKEEAKVSGWLGECIDPARYVASQVSAWNLSGSKGTVYSTSRETEAFRKYRDRMC